MFDIPDGESQPSWSIMSQSPWRRIAISLAGVAANLIVAYGCLFSWARFYVCDKEVPTTYVVQRTVAVTMKCLDNVRHDIAEAYTPGFIKSSKDVDSSGQRDVAIAEAEGNNTNHNATPAKGDDSYTNRFFPSGEAMRETSVSAQHFLWRFANINLLLFLLNLLPIPPLDSAQTLFSTYEYFFRRPINETLRIILILAGTVLLLGMMAFDILSDVLHFLFSSL